MLVWAIIITGFYIYREHNISSNNAGHLALNGFQYVGYQPGGNLAGTWATTPLIYGYLASGSIATIHTLISGDLTKLGYTENTNNCPSISGDDIVANYCYIAPTKNTTVNIYGSINSVTKQLNLVPRNSTYNSYACTSNCTAIKIQTWPKNWPK